MGESQCPDTVIVSPADAPAVGDLLDKISKQRHVNVNNMVERLELLATTRALTQALETPRETLLRYTWSEVNHTHSHCAVVQ